MKGKLFLWLLGGTNIFLLFCLFFIFSQYYKCKVNWELSFSYAKALEAKISLNREYIHPIKLPDINGNIVNLYFSSNKRFVFILVAPIDCEICIEQAYEIGDKLSNIRGLEIVWIFSKTNQFELLHFINKENLSKFSKILIDPKGEIAHNWNCNTPSIVFTEGSKVKYYIKLKGVPYQTKQILNEICFLMGFS
ncbi:MAG: redoxin domain-containing protein [candidate division WOR-3 bacterium]